MKTCYIFSSIPCRADGFARDKTDLVIAADKGYENTLRMGIKADLVVGDFDSLGYIPEGGEILRHPAEKDDTDTMLAVKTAIERGFRRIVIYGGIGGRLDHTFANIQTLAYASGHGAEAFLVDGRSIITSLTNEKITVNGEGTASVFAFGKAKGVSISGLKYPLCGYEMSFDFPIGVSNEFTGTPATLEVKDGTLIFMWTGDLSDITKRRRL